MIAVHGRDMDVHRIGDIRLGLEIGHGNDGVAPGGSDAESFFAIALMGKISGAVSKLADSEILKFG